MELRICRLVESGFVDMWSNIWPVNNFLKADMGLEKVGEYEDVRGGSRIEV